MAYPRYILSRTLVKARRTAGNLTLNSTNWANVDTGLDLVLKEVQVGDELVYGLSSTWGAEAVTSYLDVVTIVSASPVNSFGIRGAVETSPGVTGVQVWRGFSSGASQAVGGVTPPYTVVAGDLTAGAVTLRLRYVTTTAANKTLRAASNDPLDVWAWNLGPLQG